MVRLDRLELDMAAAVTSLKWDYTHTVITRFTPGDTYCTVGLFCDKNVCEFHVSVIYVLSAKVTNKNAMVLD